MPLTPNRSGGFSGSIDLLSQEYNSQSADQNQTRLINMYLEPDKSKGRDQLVAYPTPGLVLFCDTGEANVRALRELNGVTYVVAGNKFGSVNGAGVFTQLGSNLSTSSGFAKIKAVSGGSDTNNQLIIIDGTNGYSYNIGTATATFPISDADFPDTATDIETLHDYTIVQVASSIKYQISSLADSLTWATLDFASKIAQPDSLTAVVNWNDRLWLLGNRTMEVWEDIGNVDFPFEKTGGIFVQKGCAAKQSVVICQETLHMLSTDNSGGFQFLKFNGFVPVPIETTPIAETLQNMTVVSDCIGYSYNRSGHEFIDWTFPTENVTFTYDATTGIWLTRQSYISAAYGRFLGSCATFCYNKSLIGDYNSGKIYYQSSTTYTENSVAIRRMFVSPPLYMDGRRIYVHRLQMDVQTNIGSSKTFTLEMSTDSGQTWESIDTYTVPTTSAAQIYTSSLGSGYNFIFRITTTMNAKFMLLGFRADFSVGDH